MFFSCLIIKMKTILDFSVVYGCGQGFRRPVKTVYAKITVSLIFQIIMHASDFQENDTAHEYHADNPDFPAKTIVATLFIGAFFGYLNDTLLNVALTPIMKDFGVDKTTVQWLTTGFLLVMGAFTPITAGVIQWFETTLHLSPEMTIAFAHGTFNITNTIIQFPFIGALAYFVTKLIPGEDEVVKYEPLYLDENLITQAPSIALGNAKKELLHLGGYADKAFNLSYDYIVHQNEKTAEKGHKTEEAINTIDDDLTRYLIRLSSEALSPRESEVLTNILDSSRDLERIGDHAEALINLTDYLIRKKVVFSEAALAELEDIYNQTHQFVEDALKAVENNDVNLANQLVARHEAIENLEKKLRKTHIRRLNHGECTPQAGVNFIDIISHYTRVADHAMNLAEKVQIEQI